MISLCVGQCGVQVGQTFHEFVGGELSRSRGGGVVNAFSTALLVDSEPKVVNGAAAKSTFTSCTVLHEQGGYANNWAMGYYASKSLLTQALDALRVALEKSEFVINHIHIFHSIGGGTGSGLGSRLIEMFREEFGS